jgi:hypothetical protein
MLKGRVHDYFGLLEGYVSMSQNYLDVCDSQNKILSPAKIREFRSIAFSVANGKALKIYIAIFSPISVQNFCRYFLQTERTNLVPQTGRSQNPSEPTRDRRR